MLLRAVTVLGRPDAEKELKGVTEIVAVVAIKRIRAVVDGELGSEADVDTLAVREVVDVTERVSAHRKNFGFQLEQLTRPRIARITRIQILIPKEWQGATAVRPELHSQLLESAAADSS